MLHSSEFWKGEHFIRAPMRQEPEPIEKMRPPPRRQPLEVVVERRKRVRKLIKAGMTASEIGRAEGVPSSTIYKDAKILGLKCRNAKAKDI